MREDDRALAATWTTCASVRLYDSRAVMCLMPRPRSERADTGCHRVQGFLISPPMHPNEGEPFLREQLAVSEASTSA